MALILQILLVVAILDLLIVAMAIVQIANGQPAIHTAFFDPQIEFIARFIN
jgi:hypothetical protein